MLTEVVVRGRSVKERNVVDYFLIFFLQSDLNKHVRHLALQL